MHESVLTFINRFTCGNPDRVITVFTNGCCYWFAKILSERFSSFSPIIMYDEVMNHFGTKIGDNVYDITGNVTEKYKWEPWDDMDDELLKARIARDCIMF